jgi:TonB family protein
MCCKNLRKTYIPFLLAFMFGSLMANVLSVSEIPSNYLEKKVEPLKVSNIIQEGRGSASCSGISKFKLPDKSKLKEKSDPNNKSLKLISKPQPRFTKEARQNDIQGEVVLRIKFLANGQIGSITPIKELPFGLTEQAIESAKRIRFEPAVRNGRSISVLKSLKYSFTIY